jgi:hypothetical protein
MRWYIVFIILLTLSINDFALTAPVLVQEKRHACVDAVHVPKDVVTVLDKRVGDDLKQLGEYIDFFKAADEHAPSGSAPSEPGHGSTLDVPVPAPNPASPTVNPAPLTEPLSLSLGLSPTGSSMKGVTDNLNTGQNSVKSPEPPSLPPPAPLRDASLQDKWRNDGLDATTLQPPPSKRPRLGLGSKPDVPAQAPDLALPTVSLASLTKTPASWSDIGRYYSNKLAALAEGRKPPVLWMKQPGPKNPVLPAVPEQEVGTAPSPNPSSSIEPSD